jgi:hypothetical protein
VSGRPGMRFAPRRCAGCPAVFTPASGHQRFCMRECWRRYRGLGPELAEQVRVCGRCQARYTPAAAGQRYCGGCASPSIAPAQHQIRLSAAPDPRAYHDGMAIIMSCTCTARGGNRQRREVIEARTRFPAADAIAAWRAWHAERGVVV